MITQNKHHIGDIILKNAHNKPKVGDIIRVRITNIVESLGAFARMPNGQDGLIRLCDIAWLNQTNILKSFSIGEEIDVKVV